MMILEKNKNLKDYNTLGLNVNASFFAAPTTVAGLRQLLRENPFSKGNILVTGSGSNILYAGDYDGLVLHPQMKDISIANLDKAYVYVRAGAGVDWDDFVEWCVGRGWGGVENLSGIPGCVGASPVQNIGAYGAEAGDFIHEVELVMIDDASEKRLKGEECRFGYRDSIFKNELKQATIITYVTFKLSLHPSPNTSYAEVAARLADYSNPGIGDVRKAILEIREAKLPDPKVVGNAGSFFKNPVVPVSVAEKIIRDYPDLKPYPAGDGIVKVPAGWLIEKCGFKGKREGNVGVHYKQALVLLAYEGASGKELIEWAQKIKRSVKDRFDIDIYPEVNIIASS
jgi:UDP-N-acetylmuramate dehydrogenase